MAGLFDLNLPRKPGDRLERALQEGERYLRKRQFAAVERVFEFAAREYPGDPRPYLGLAALHRARGEESVSPERTAAGRRSAQSLGAVAVMLRLVALLSSLVLLMLAPYRSDLAGAQTEEPRTVPVSADEVSRGDPGSPRIALVVNVGAGFTPAISMLDTLRDRGLRTTFFVMGWWAERNPEILTRIAADGHEIASHGHSVFDLTSVSDAAVVADLESADAVIAAVTGRTTRPLWSASAGYRDARVLRLAASLGYRPIYLTVDSLDWREGATAEGVYRRVMSQTANGSIVVLHFDSPTTTTSTAAVLGQLIDDLRAQDFVPGTVTQLLLGD